MKTLLKLVATLLAWVATPALAAPPPTAITIFSERGQPFGLALDGRLLTRPWAQQVHLDWLAPGQHWADFTVPTAYGPPLRFRTAVWLQPGLATNYVLVLRPYGPQLRQVGAVALGGPAGYGPGTYPPPPNGYYGGQASPNLGGYGQTLPPGGYYGNGQQNNPYGSQGNYPNGGQYDQRSNRPSPYPNSGNGQYGSGGSQRSMGNYPAPDGSYAPNTANSNALPPGAVAELADAMRRQRSDEERLEIAKQTLDQNSVRAQELVTLLQMLNSEEARVELAEFGYAHITDPQNFNSVYDAFQTGASVREVQRALGIQH